MSDETREIQIESQRDPRPVGARLTIVQSIYYQSPGLDPDQRESRYDVEVNADEQPYYRRLTLEPDGIEFIDTQWVDDPGCLLIENLEGQQTQMMPTPEDIKAMAAKVIEVNIGHAVFLIHPKDCQRLMLTPDAVHEISLTTQSNSPIRYSVTAYAR